MKNCPVCGGELESGLLRSGHLIYWTGDIKPGMYTPSKKAGDIIPPGASRFLGSDCPSYYCKICELLLTPTKEEETP